MPTLTLPTFTFESGATLRDVPVAYHTWGALEAGGRNAVVVCHALTGDSDAREWWGPMIGPGKVLDTDRFFVVCFNVLGSPYGSLSPVTPTNGALGRYGPDLPQPTVRDSVRLHRAALEALGATSVALAVGGSMGGMQALEWAFERDAAGEPLVRAFSAFACGAAHSPWCIGWSDAQRHAIYADPNWQGGRYALDAPPRAGLASARMTAMLTYRTSGSFGARFGREHRGTNGSAAYEAEHYLRYQGQKLVDRFDAGCYVTLTKLMDTHDVGRGRGGLQSALATLTQPALVMGIDTDLLYPVTEQQALAEALPNATFGTIRAPEGHDAFLIAFDQMEALLRPFMAEHVAVGAAV